MRLRGLTGRNRQRLGSGVQAEEKEPFSWQNCPIWWVLRRKRKLSPHVWEGIPTPERRLSPLLPAPSCVGPLAATCPGRSRVSAWPSCGSDPGGSCFVSSLVCPAADERPSLTLLGARGRAGTPGAEQLHTGVDHGDLRKHKRTSVHVPVWLAQPRGRSCGWSQPVHLSHSTLEEGLGAGE